MLLNADVGSRVVVDGSSVPWVALSTRGVHRKMLDRDGGEAPRTTSIVRYEPGASFEEHAHPLGEEILVLDGTFVDEHGVYPEGTYIKNPPGSSHHPFSDTGCTLLVKLRHLDRDDGERFVVRTGVRRASPERVVGMDVIPLSRFRGHQTSIMRLGERTTLRPHRHDGGEEIFVIEGTLCDEHGVYPEGTWLRNPHLSEHCCFTAAGCALFIKTGHLPVP